MPTKMTVLCCCLLVSGNLIKASTQARQQGMIPGGKLQVHYGLHGSGAPLIFVQQHPEDNRWPQLAKPPASLRMGQWKKPLLIIVGDEDIPFILAVSTWMHATIRGSKRVVIPHTAHMLNMERPLYFNQTIQDFLNPAMTEPE